MHKTILLFLIASAFQCMGQKPTEKRMQQIKDEANALYILERASTVSLDLFYDNEYNPSTLKGYLSYKDKDSLRTIMYTEKDTANAQFRTLPDSIKSQYKEKTDLIVVTYNFSYSKSVSKKGATINETARMLTPYEKLLLDARFKINKIFDADTAVFKRYEKTVMSFLPIDYGKTIQFFVITLPTTPEILIFGNDYLFEYDIKSKEIVKKEKLHQVYYNVSPKYHGKKSDVVKNTFHWHKKGDSPFITSTDICLLMLYKGGVEWDQHWVYSEKWVSAYTLYNSKLSIESTKAFNELSKPPEKDPYDLKEEEKK